MKKKNTILLVFLFLPLLFISQSFYFEGYGVRNGLAQSNVAAVLQDNEGYYWLATESGVSKFDGKNFYNYTTENGLAHNNATALLLDKSHTLWIGHNNGQLTKYDGKTFKALNIPSMPADKKIYSLFEDSKGQIWVGSNNGAILIKHPESDLNENNVVYYSSQEGLSPIVLSVQENKHGRIWFLTDIGIKELNTENKKFDFVRLPGMPLAQITTFLITKKNESVVGTSNGAIYKINPDSQTADLLFDVKQVAGIGSFANNFIYSLFEDSRSNIWASIYNSGACKIDLKNRSVLFNTSNGLPANKIKSIAEDREGHILLGTVDEGLQVFKGEKFTALSKANGLVNSQVYSICEDAEHNVWLGTNEGISIYNPHEITNDKKITNIPVINGSPVNNVRAIVKDQNGNMFVACWGGRVVKYNTQNKTFSAIPELFESVNPYVSCLMIDHSNKLWIGSVDGLTTYDLNSGQIKSLRTVNGLSGNDITCIVEDSKQIIWIGTKQNGVTTIQNGKYNIFHKDNGLLNNNITSICEDNKGTMWIGTEGRGIFAYANNTFKNHTVKDGLLSNYITLITVDKNNHIWMGTNKGLCKLDPSTKQVATYQKSDGFTGIETKLNAVLNNTDIWFGTVNGAFKYSSQFDQSEPVPPVLHLTTFKVNLKDATISDKTELSYKENSLTFEFIGISLANPEGILYKFKLEGYDEDWRPATKENHAVYANLPPGHYVFHVSACNSNGSCSEELKMEVVVAPPFWRTWWFYILVVITVITILFTYIKIRERNLILEKKVLEDKVEERTAEVVQKNKELDEKNKDITASIRYAKRIQDAILPPDDFVRTYLPKTFILFKPKDIVSGDFYWLDDKKDMVLFAAVDCTGHGVPGAFMSIVGHSKLDQIVGEQGITTPSAILNELNKSVSDTLRQSYTEDNSVKDGMDIALCAFNRKTNILEYAGAYNPLWLIRNGELIEYKADKFPIGNLKAGENKKFTNHSIQLTPGDTLYIYSDGFADQFGGADGKKFKYSAFKKLLLENQHLSMEEQGELLNTTIENWRGTLEQVDDILVIGTRL